MRRSGMNRTSGSGSNEANERTKNQLTIASTDVQKLASRILDEQTLTKDEVSTVYQALGQLLE